MVSEIDTPNYCILHQRGWGVSVDLERGLSLLATTDDSHDQDLLKVAASDWLQEDHLAAPIRGQLRIRPRPLQRDVMEDVLSWPVQGCNEQGGLIRRTAEGVGGAAWWDGSMHVGGQHSSGVPFGLLMQNTGSSSSSAAFSATISSQPRPQHSRPAPPQGL